jgi:predicted nucleotidyltransferase
MGTKSKILEYIANDKKTRAEEIRSKFKISRVMVHKHLLNLQKSGLIFKYGKPPLVFYTTKRNETSIIDGLLEDIKKYNPQKVILFGSQAYGTVNEDSDYDIAIIKNVNKPYRERLIEIRNLVRTTVPIDFFIFNQNEIDRYKDNNPIVKNILTEGKVLYEQ